MKNGHYLICRSLLLRDLQTLGYRLHDRLHNRRCLAAENCLALTLALHRLSLSLHGLSLTLRHCLNRTLHRLWLPCIHRLCLTLHRLGLSLHRLSLSLRHSLGRTLICGPCYVRRPRHALVCLLDISLLSHTLVRLALESSLMLYSLNNCRISRSDTWMSLPSVIWH